MKRIALIGEYDAGFEPHTYTEPSIQHSANKLDASVRSEWISTSELTKKVVAEFDGLWIAPGSPYKNLDRTLAAIQVAREIGTPLFGTCAGFQHVVLEIARNVLGIPDATSAEYDPNAASLFISPLTCSLAGQEMSIDLVPGSLAHRTYGCDSATERYYCNFGLNPEYGDQLQSAIKAAGTDTDGEVRILELSNHPFYLATLFVPEARSTLEQPHPLVTAFVEAVLGRVTRMPS